MRSIQYLKRSTEERRTFHYPNVRLISSFQLDKFEAGFCVFSTRLPLVATGFVPTGSVSASSTFQNFPDLQAAFTTATLWPFLRAKLCVLGFLYSFRKGQKLLRRLFLKTSLPVNEFLLLTAKQIIKSKNKNTPR